MLAREYAFKRELTDYSFLFAQVDRLGDWLLCCRKEEAFPSFLDNTNMLLVHGSAFLVRYLIELLLLDL